MPVATVQMNGTEARKGLLSIPRACNTEETPTPLPQSDSQQDFNYNNERVE
jgi:hypothetical protein